VDDEPGLFYWSANKAARYSSGEEYEDFKPDYKKSDEALEVDIKSLMRQIALSD